MSRRKRCPFCRSLNTVEAFSACRDGSNPQFFHVCDDCDQSFSDQKTSPMYVDRRAHQQRAGE